MVFFNSNNIFFSYLLIIILNMFVPCWLGLASLTDPSRLGLASIPDLNVLGPATTLDPRFVGANQSFLGLVNIADLRCLGLASLPNPPWLRACLSRPGCLRCGNHARPTLFGFGKLAGPIVVGSCKHVRLTLLGSGNLACLRLTCLK